MTAIAIPLPKQSEVGELKARLKSTWMTGDYDTFARYMEADAEKFYRQLGIAPGARLLDVGCGAGQVALIAARAGADATGCDIATNWIEKARARAAAEGLKAAFDEGDAEALPYEDAQFDSVVSLFGAMFAPQPELVASEMIRVCRPGGTIAMGNWTPGGFIGQMFKAIAKHIAPSGMPAPVLWGDEETVRNRFSEGTLEVRCTPRTYTFQYPFSPEAVVEFFRVNYGPMTKAFASLDSNGQARLRGDLVDLWASYNRAKGNATEVEAEYLEVVAIRSGEASDVSRTATIRSIRAVRGERAQALATRIEEGAALLADFAAGLTEAEWRTPVSETDRRIVGGVVHHVASMYPIEIGVAQKVAKGEAVTDVSWELVATINARHASEHMGATKAAALELLRKNSLEAADAVRQFTDEELDRAAPFGLSYGAPVTTQFVIEDHSLRHSWHHLARIRKALGR